MKIGENTLGVSTKDKIKIISFVFVGYIILGVLLDWVFGRNFQTWYFYLAKGVCFGLVFSIGFYFIIKKMTKGIMLKLDIPLEEGEELEAYGIANLFLKGQAIGGKLGLTQAYLVFHSHKFNFSKRTVRIAFTDIQHVKGCKTMGLIDNGLLVQVADQDCRFVVNDRAKWIEVITKKIKQ